MPCIGQGVAAGVPQHVDVNLEGKAGALAYPPNREPTRPRFERTGYSIVRPPLPAALAVEELAACFVVITAWAEARPCIS